MEGRMARKFVITGGPSREDLFDCLRLDNRHNRMFHVQFRVAETTYPLILETIHSLERGGNPHAHDHQDWIIRVRSTKIPADFRALGEKEMFAPYIAKIIYNTKTRQGTAFVTRERPKK